MWSVSILCIIFAIAAPTFSVPCDPVIQLETGEVRGHILKSRDGRDFFSFSGIPYAKPPIDDLRFMPPVLIDPWNGTLDATKEPHMCIQNYHFFVPFKHIIQGQEDCLYMNVHTPYLHKKLPVMVWIYGGGFVAGHSQSNLYGPDYFMDKDVVFVSFNYRLGLLGFLSTEDDVMPGNFGMKDQVMALRWVRDNIDRFGGDPSRVTIFGESAGAACTGYQLLSPMSKGLFHKAIIQSGSPVCRWAVSMPGLARKRTEAVATLAGCHPDTSENILKCLRKVSATYLVEIHNKFFEWLNYPSVLFPPVVESCDSDEEAFLCHHPITDFKQESFVPTIIGFTSGEGGLVVSGLFNETSLLYPELATDFSRVLASILGYKHAALPEDLDEIGSMIMKHYYPSGKIDDDTHLTAVDMIGEGLFISCTMDMALKLAPPVYWYQFDYRNEFSFNSLYGDCKKHLGVTHGDEMANLFPLKVFVPHGLNKTDLEVSKLMVNIWAKFASSETPTIDGTEDGTVWPELSSTEESFLHINSVKPEIIRNPLTEMHKFWGELPLTSGLKKHASPKKPIPKNNADGYLFNLNIPS